MAPIAPKSNIVLVTGANQGIGFEIARKLAAERADYHIIMAGRRKNAIEEAASELEQKGYSVEPLVLDLESDESIAAAAKTVDAKYGRLDVLVNNAAIAFPPDDDTSLREQWRVVYNTNVFGTALLTDAMVPLLEKSKTGSKRIVFVTSGLGSLGMKVDPKSSTYAVDVPMYSTTKAALNLLALHYVTRLGDADPAWKINLTCPGYCATKLNKYTGTLDPSNGAINAFRLATLGPGGETATYSNKEGPIAW